MPEFDEETYKKKQHRQSMSYEPGRNAEKYKSRPPNFRKKSADLDNETSSLWVEAATSTNYQPPKREKRPRSEREKDAIEPNAGGRPRDGQRRGRDDRRRKLTLWEKVLSFFGIKPKRKGRPHDKGGKPRAEGDRPKGGDRRHGGKPGNQDRQGGRPDRREPRGGDNRNRQGGRSGQGGERPYEGQRQRPQNDGDASFSGEEGEGRKRRRRSRGGNRERNASEGSEPSGNFSHPSEEGSEREPRRDREPRREREHRADREPRGDRQPRGDRENRREREPRRERDDTRQTELRMESVAAPRVEGEQITLGAIDLGGDSTPTAPSATANTGTGGRGRKRNSGSRAASGAAASASTGGFVPHPIEIDPTPPDGNNEA